MGIENRPDRLSPPDAVVFRPWRIHEDWAIYNTAAIQTLDEAGEAATYYLSRAVYIPDIHPGMPDLGVIVVSTRASENSHYLERLPDLDLPIGREEGGVVNWEDPRTANVDGAKTVIGLTAVCVEQGSFQTHPALVEVGIGKSGLQVKSTRVFKEEKGKNVVPLSEDKFIFRREDETHVLHIAKSGPDDTLTVEGEIDFSQYSKIGWLQKKLGAVSRPIRVGKDFSLLPIHGVRNGRTDNGEEVDDVYTLGLAVLDRKWEVLAVDPKPLFKREDFLKNLPISKDLNPRKSVVYCCGYEEYASAITLFMTVGDRITVPERLEKSDLADRAMSLLKAG